MVPTDPLSQMWNDPQYVTRYNNIYTTANDQFALYTQMLALDANDDFLDLGCGCGDFIHYICNNLSPNARPRTITAVDQSKEQLQLLRQKSGGESDLYIVEKPFLELFPAHPHRFNKIFARASLHHLNFEDKKIFFRMLKPHLTPSTLFLLYDMVFEFPLSHLDQQLSQLQQEASIYYGESWEIKKSDIVHTWFQEYPEDLSDWQEVFAEAGLQLKQRVRITSFLSKLLWSNEVGCGR
ncbi:MAG: class I SAM-dependent methyltransferase [Oligoflexia bacterium]|nr:class I SAM-dependent methyltransferase [Oligoflexia bacterium]